MPKGTEDDREVNYSLESTEQSPNPTAEVQAVKTDTLNLLGDLKKEITVSQDHKDQLLAENVIVEAVRDIVEGFFGKGRISSFLVSLTDKITKSVFLADNVDISDAEFYKMVDKAKLETAIISHRANLDTHQHPDNSLASIEEAVKAGEEVEFDLRLGSKNADGSQDLVLSHDPVTGEVPKLADALSIFAKYPDSKLVIDLKTVGTGEDEINMLLQQLQQADLQYKDEPNYKSLLDRTILASFNPYTLKLAAEKMPNCPKVFHYIPVGKEVHKLMSSGVINSSKMNYLASQIDDLSDGKLGLTEKLSYTNILTGDPFSSPGTENKEVVSIYAELPPESVLKNIQYVSIPFACASADLIEKIQAAGVKVAVWGFVDPKGDSQLQKQHDQDVKAAMAMGANVLITDRPQFIR